MKKYLLLILSMLSVSIGTWADPTPFYTGASSTFEISGGTITLNINASGEIDAAVNDWQKWSFGGNMPSDIAAAKTAGFTTLKIITAANVAMTSGDGEGLYAFGNNYQVLDLSQATVTLNNGKVRLGGITNRACQPNIIVPAAYSSAPGTFPAANQDGNSITGGVNLYSIDGTTVNAAMNNSTVTTALTNISSTATRMKIMNEVGAIDLTSVITSAMVTELSSSTYTIDLMDITTVSSGSNDITVADGVKVVCISDGVKSRIKGTDDSNITVANPIISCTAENLDGELEKLDNAGVAPTSITITSGELSSTDITSLNIEGLTYLSLENATLAVNINTLTIPSTLQSLTLPKNATPETAIDATLLDKVKAASSLLYVYVPYSGTQNANQTVADYVWANKAGGLWQAMHNEAYLKTAVYVKVASNVAGGVQLNELDAKFGDHDINASDATNYPWQYIDLSETFFGVAATNANTAPHDKGYRIILPDNLTGDNMAIFASKPETDISDNPDRGYRGKVAAVYSYNGTKLSLLEITDNTYHTNALADPRIVRSGTTEIKVISGSYNGTTFSKFGPNLLAAINAADDTPGDGNAANNHITKVTVAVGTGIYTAADAIVSEATTFYFNNDNLTNLDLSYTNNSNVTIDVSGCAGLTNFQMNEATVAAVNAFNSTTPLNNLATVSLGHTTVGGNVNLSGTSLTTDLEVDLANITGTLNVSNTQATSFDFSKLTAMSVNASNTTALTSLNLNGIKLNGMPDSGTDAIASDNITARIGTVEVTRTGGNGGNYNNLTISTAPSDEFDPNRIVPGWSTITPEGNRYTVSAIEKVLVEITAAGNTLSDNVDTALSTIGGTPAPTAANVEILHVTGTLTTTDLEYIKDNMPALKLLDLSEATLSGVTATDLTTASANSKKISTSTAIVLSGLTNDESVILTDVKTLQDAGFECVAYYTSKANKRLNVYAYSGTVGKLKSSSPAVIDNATGITFLPRYYDTTPESTSNQYPEAQPSLLTALGTLPPFSIDMTWLNIDKLGVNFGGLNENTHYLVIPQNSSAATITRSGIVYHNDFTTTGTDGVVDGTEHRYYHFGENIYAVSTYKSQNGPWAQKAYFGGEATELGPWIPNKQSTANLTYVNSTGHLGACIPYMSTRQTEAEIHAIAGTVNSTDITSLSSGVTNSYLDLSRSTLSGDITWSSYSNASVKIIVMPHEYSTTASGLPTVGSCAQLYGIGCHLLSDVDASNGAKKCTLVYMAQKEGGMADMIKASNRIHPGLATRYNRVTSLIVGGPVNAFDLSTRTDGIDDNGHLMTSVDENNIMTVAGTGNSGSLSGYAGVMDYWDLSKVTLPIYNTRDGKDYCFDNSTHTYATSDTSTDGFSYQNDLCFSMIGLVPDTYDPFSCKLPTDESVWRLPTDAFYNGHGMTELNLPFNYQYIGNGAFTDTYLTHITTTDAINGNIVDNGEHTYTLSANLKEIGDNPGVGKALDANQTVFPQNREVYDVYVLATDVPKCYANAFAANVLYGWGGFQGGTFPYCRDKYINGSNWFCVLRYPYKAAWDAAHSTSGARESGFDLASRRAAPSTTLDLTTIDNYEEMEAAYTDVYKIYTKKEQTGAVDANGNAILWPTFSELQRVSAQALTNEVWYDWATAYNEQQEVNTSSSYDSGTYTTLEHAADNDKHYDFEEYKGWHQFVLTQATYVESVEQNAPEREYEQKGWYTFCIPYDLTEDQVYEMLGVPYSTAQYTNKVGNNRIKKSDESTEAGVIERILPDIRTLKQVERTPGTPNVVSLRLTDNLTEAISGKYSYWNVTNNTTGPTSDYVECGTKGDPNAVVIKGGYPYYIQPYLLKGETVKNLGKYVMSRYGDKFKKTASCVNHDITMEYLGDKDAAPKDRLATLKFAKPLEEHKIWAKYDDNDDSTDPYEFHDKDNDIKYNYTFVGQFWDQKLPRYCYYTMEGTGNWYRLAANKNYTWNAYKCVIMATQEVDDTATHPQSGKFRKNSGEEGEIISFYPTIATGTTDLLDDALRLAFLDGLDDYDFGSSSARRYMFTFDDVIMDSETDGQVTAIETLDGNSIVPATGKVYNMAGQHVGNSLESLPKGMYIANGKKVIVK